MASSQLETKRILLSDQLIALINKPQVHFDEIDALLSEELKLAPGGKALDQLTQLIHLVSFIQTKRFSNPIWALQIFINDTTSKETRKALLKALEFAPAQEDKIYNLVCILAENNKLARYSQITQVPSLRFRRTEGDREHIEEANDWYLIFDVFGLCKTVPIEVIPLIAKLLITMGYSVDDLRALELFFKFLNTFDKLHKNIIEPMLPQLKNKGSIDNFHSLLRYLADNQLLKANVLEHIQPLLPHVHALKIFFEVYLLELQAENSQEETLSKVHSFCRMTLPKEGSYDDVVKTNTPLHQAIIDRNLANLGHALDLANSKLILATSYDNTALVLACKLADKDSAMLILKKMRRLGCDVNQADHYGMTALHWARFYHFDDLSMALIAAGANETLRTINGKNCAYFAKHPFTLADLKIEGREIIEDSFTLKNSSLTDIAFHADKIALNLKLTTQKEVMDLYQNDEGAQIRTSNLFYLFFKTFRTRLIEWLGKQSNMDYQSSQPEPAQRSMAW